MKTLATLVLTTAALTAGANADLVGNYFILPNNIPGTPRHIDVQSGIDGGIVTGLVQSTLGPNGLPVATNLAKTRVAGSGNIQDLDATTDEILWWTPGRTGNRTVLFEKTQSDPTPFTMRHNFFPDGQNSNAWGFRAVHWTGSFFMNAGDIASLTMSLEADDDAWIFINNTLAVDNGGVKAIGHVSNLLGTGMVNAGWNTIDIFFADRNQVQSGIGFRTNASIIPTPGAAALIGLGGLCASRRRRV
jgi:fibro-slime domain-containing protein